MRKLFPITLAILAIFLFSVVPADKAEATPAEDYFNAAVNEVLVFGINLDSLLANNLPFLASTGDVMGMAILKTGHFEIGLGIGVVAATGADDIERICPVCDKRFNTNRYRGAKHCSRKCGAVTAQRKRESVPRKQGRYTRSPD